MPSSKIIQKITKFVRNPVTQFPRAIKDLQRRACSIFQNASFFMQGQMDINPKSFWHRRDFVRLTGGFYPQNDSNGRRICNLEPWDNTRRDMLILLLRTITEKSIIGDFAELGVYKGYTAKLIHHYAPERRLHLFDTFEGFTERGVVSEKAGTNLQVSASDFADTSLGGVREYISQRNDNVLYYKGYFPESIPSNFNQSTFAFVHLDADLYEPIIEGLRYFYPRMSTSGVIIVHDYNAWPGARKAVDEFFSDKKEFIIPMPDKSGSVLMVKQ